MLTVRPKVAELVFHVFGRSVHPELFRVLRSQTIRRDKYEAKIDITSAGHVVTWRYGGLTLTEVAASAGQLLPMRRRLMHYRLKGHRHDALKYRGQAHYQMSFQLESAVPEVFWNTQSELIADGMRQGLLHRFDPSGRIALGAVSFVHVEARNRQLLVHAYHTFPDDCAIVRTQSLFRLP